MQYDAMSYIRELMQLEASQASFCPGRIPEPCHYPVLINVSQRMIPCGRELD